MRLPWRKRKAPAADSGFPNVTLRSVASPMGSVVKIDGMEIRKVRYTSVGMRYDGATEVTITLLANLNTEE